VAATPALELKDVSKRFGTRWAVARLTYSVPQGTSLLLTGHNGSGKTTLLRMISTVTFATAGEIHILGRETRANREVVRRDVALLSHQNFLYEDLTAEQNLLLLARLLTLPDPETKVARILERVKLNARRDSPARHFSAGMRKRLAIARLLLKEPKLALLDEPFGELDPAGIADMEVFIKELQAKGTTVILATHLVAQGLRLTTERLHLENGRLTVPTGDLRFEG
jgi:heme exporter protein A